MIELPTASGPAVRSEKPPLLDRAPKGRAVLLVDDEPAILCLLAKILAAEGCRVETAASLSEAVAKTGRRPFDLAVVDAHMGDGPGLSLYEDWTGSSPFPAPPFLFITGDVLNTAMEKAFSARRLPLLCKPVDIQIFKQAVRALLKGAPIVRDR